MITAGIEKTHYTRAIRADKERPGLLYAGTEWGMYISFDDGQQWQPFQLNLPIVSIRDLHIKDNMLIAATHGRSFWMIDDLTPLQELDESIAKKEVHLFKSKPAYRIAQKSSWGSPNHKLVGMNHPNGVLFHYFIKELEGEEPVTLQIQELDGTVIQTFDNKTKEKKQNCLLNQEEIVLFGT